MAGKGRSPKGGKKPSWQRFLREWGIYLLIGAAIVAVFLFLGRGGGKASLVTVAPYRVYFTQGELGHPRPAGLEAEIIADIAAASRGVELATPGLDLPQLAEALIAARARGVTVQVVEDLSRQEDPAVQEVAARLQESGIPVLWRSRLGESFLVIDARIAWVGSWDLSRRGLEEDAGLVLRCELVPLAADFHAEFTEMVLEAFAGGFLRLPTVVKTPYPYLAIPDGPSLSVYRTPEDAALSGVLQALARAQDEILVLGELNDSRLGERLLAEASRSTMLTVWAVLDEGGSDPNLLRGLAERKVNLGLYTGPGRMYENVLVVDGQNVAIFSQPMAQEAYDRNDGYVLLVRDRELGQLLQRELARLYAGAKKAE